VTEIDDYAFRGCSNMTSVKIGSGVQNLSFNSVNFDLSDKARLTTIEVDDANPVYSSVDGVLFTKYKNTLVRYPAGKQGAYTVPSSVTTIGERAFYNSKGLTSITIGNNVDSIQYGAFYACSSLTSISIGNSVASLSSFDFPSYTALTEIVIGESNAKYSSLDGVLFNKTQDTLLQHPLGKQGAYTIPDGVKFVGKAFRESRGLTSVVIGDGLTAIGDSTFWDCGILTSVKIGENVATVGNQAFGNCASLTSVVSPRVSPPTANAGAFAGVSVSSAYLYIPETSGDVYAAANVWKDFGHIKPIKDVITVTFNSKGGNAVGFQLVVEGVKVASPIDPVRSGYIFGGWYKEEACTNAWNFETDAVATEDITLYAKWSVDPTTSIASPTRVIPQTKPTEEATVVAPTVVLSGEFTAGPNPISRQSGIVNFFRQGKRVRNSELRVYDATGNIVNSVKIRDKAIGNQARRKVGSWDLCDKNGRIVSEGTYLVKGVIKTSDGKSEKVSVIMGVR
jgi:uncharacterized repeat protein (TIGR02543 family)